MFSIVRRRPIAGALVGLLLAAAAALFASSAQAATSDNAGSSWEFHSTLPSS